MQEHNLHWLETPDCPYRILNVSISGSQKINITQCYKLSTSYW